MQTQTLKAIPLSDIVVKSNPRKRIGDLTELSDSIKQHGVITPIRVRPDGDKYELVFGQRRFLASKSARLKEIPAIVVALTDQQLLEEQLVENGQRADIHPMEEAEAYKSLRDEHRLTLDEIAAKVGKKKAHVLFRLKLNDLVPAARKAFYDDKFSAHVAYLLARIPDRTLQEQALKEITTPRWGSQAWSSREVEQHIRQRYMLDLSTAPFDRKDATLVPAAGACGPCRKRTGSDRDLFGDVSEKQVCTDTPCFESKVKASWTQAAERALARGQEVLSEEDSAVLFPHGVSLSPHAPYVDLDTRCPVDPKLRLWGQLLGKSKVARVLAQDGYHKTHTLVRAEEALEGLKALGYDFATKAKPNPKTGALATPAQDHQKKLREEVAHRGAVVRAGLALIVETAESTQLDASFWKLLLAGLAAGSWNDVIGAVVKRRGWAEKGKRPDEVLLAQIATLDVPALQGLAVELIVGRGAFWSGASDYGSTFKKACETYGLDLKQLSTEVKAATEEKKAQKAA